jgi:hypothetical protein
MTKGLRQVGLVVLVILATSGVWQAAAQVEAKKERPKWEYTYVGDGAGAVALGNDGWELVAVTQNPRENSVLYFKRMK